MKALKSSLKKHKKEKNEFAWMVAVAHIHQAYDNTLKARKEKLFQLEDNKKFKTSEGEVLKQIGGNLLEKQGEIVPKLKKMTQKQRKMADLYFENDALKGERQKLLNQLNANKYDLKEKLAAEVNKLR